jgi:phage/plasmid-like protein (TIGR03299 family)
MAHEVESMMYVGETPWHGLGKRLDSPPTIGDAIIQGGLDWTVSTVQLQMPDGRKVDRFATVRSSDNSILGTVGAGYTPAQNAETFQFFQPFLDQKVASIETAGALRKGARVWMLAKIDRADSVIVPASDDRVSKYLLVANGHDGGLALHVGITPIRVVCQNTLSAAVADRQTSTIKIRHTSGVVDALKVVQETIERVEHDFEKAAEVFRALAQVQVTEAMLRDFVDRVFRRQKLKMRAAAEAARASMAIEVIDETETKERESTVYKAIAERFETGRGNDMKGVKGTGWAAYNAATEYLTWSRGDDKDVRLQNLWFGGVGDRALVAAAETFLQAA